MAKIKQILSEVNDILKAYNYLDKDDEDINVEDIPSLVSHLLLLRVFTQESIRFGIPYEDVEDFCEFAIDHIYEREVRGEDISQIDIEEIVNAFRSKEGVTH